MTKLFQYTNYIDYDELVNKPLINKVVVEGDKSLDDYGIQPAGNYAHLNESGKVPFNELDDSILGNLQYQSVWDAEHNNPNLPLVPSKKGQYWIVSHGGERFEMEFETGDWIIAGDGVWQKIDNSDSVSSINGKVGNVVLTSDDIEYNDTTVREAIDGKQNTLIAGKNINIVDNVISAEFKDAIIDYNLTYNKPSLNNIELIGYKTLEDFDIQKTIYAGENVYLTKTDSEKMNDIVNVYEATESRKGVSEIATQEEVNTGTDDFRYVTPKKLKPIITTLETLISNEISRATTAEGVLQDNIDSEETRAKIAESGLRTDLTDHISNTSNPHNVTASQIGLGNVDNTSDLDKPISTATQTALNLKANDADLKTVAKTGVYSDLTGTPTKLSQFTNDTNYITSTQAPIQSVNGDTGDIIVQAIKNQHDNSMIKVWEGTQAQYDVITTKDTNTVYAIEGTDSIYEDLVDMIEEKQDKLIAGTGIMINGRTISNTIDINDKQDTITGAATTITSSDLTSNQALISNGSGKVAVSETTSTELGYLSGVTSSIQTQLNEKQSLLTFDTTPTALSTNPVTSNGIKTAIDVKQDKITGSSGEVLYHNGSEVFTQPLLNEGYICLNPADVNTCKNNSPSFSDVFNNWTKFSHLNGANDSKPSEMTAWTYDDTNDTIVQPQNTTSYVGFISPKTYSSYDITVRCYSTGSDDDSIGLVAAFAKDSSNREHTLSFIRTPGGTGTSTRWVCILDYTAFSLTATAYNQTIIVNNSSTVPTPISTANWNTSTIGVGTVINMTRSGNIITAACSQFNSTTIDENTRITIDLDALSETYPLLSLFKGSSPWGYSNCSQPNSMYENISVTDPDGYIFDVPNNQVLQYNSSTKKWDIVSGVTPVSSIGNGRFSYNSTTGKLFYCTGNAILQIATNTDV